MRIKEILNEASWADLVQQGKDQAAAKFGKAVHRAVTGLPGIKQAMNKYKQMAKTTQEKMAVEKAGKMAAAWDTQIAPRRAQLSVAAYQQEFREWLTGVLHQRISLEGVQTQIKTKNPSAVVRYLTEFIFPDLYNYDRPTPESPIPAAEPGDAVAAPATPAPAAPKIDPVTGLPMSPGGILLP